MRFICFFDWYSGETQKYGTYHHTVDNINTTAILSPREGTWICWLWCLGFLLWTPLFPSAVSDFVISQANGNWHGGTSPPPGASPHSDLSENSDWWTCPAWSQTTATESPTMKRRQNELTLPLQSFFMYFNCFKCTLFYFIFLFFSLNIGHFYVSK